MRYFLSPQVNAENKIQYQFCEESIIATIGDLSDTFDFSGLPDGMANGFEITTSLPICPVLQAERVDGALSVTLLNFIGEDASDEQRFPTWQEV